MALILIVDDNPDVARSLAMLIDCLDHQGVCVHSGRAALEFLQSSTPDLLILDQMMPEMDGLQVLQQLRSDPRWSRLPIVMFSAVSDARLQEQARRSGANDFWIKGSFDFQQLKRNLDRHLTPAN